MATPRRLPLRPLSILLLLLGSLPLVGCCGDRSDAELAAEERAAARQALERSLTVLPYRGLKAIVRSAGSPDRPAAFDRLLALVAATRGLPAQATTPAEIATASAAWLGLSAALVDATLELRRHDEDTFPPLWSVWGGGRPLPLPGYDAPLEHLVLGWIWAGLALSGKCGAECSSLGAYELDRATPQPGWPAPARTGALLSRGVSYCTGGYHYAADEELTGALAALAALPASQRAELGWTLADGRASLDAAQGFELIVASTHFVRAYNRLKLDRKEAATNDLEAGLAGLQRLGIENELTWWGWAFVHYRRGRLTQAGEALGKLAASPQLTPAERAEVAAAAAGLKAEGAEPGLFSGTKATVLLGKALLGRVGGVAGISRALLGEEPGAALAEQLDWLQRAAAGVGLPGDAGQLGAGGQRLGAQLAEQGTIAGRSVGEQGRSLGQSWWQRLRGWFSSQAPSNQTP